MKLDSGSGRLRKCKRRESPYVERRFNQTKDARCVYLRFVGHPGNVRSRKLAVRRVAALLVLLTLPRRLLVAVRDIGARAAELSTQCPSGFDTVYIPQTRVRMIEYDSRIAYVRR